MTTLVTAQVDADALHQCMERIVHDKCGGRSEIVGIHRQRLDQSASSACDLLTVALATGDEFQIFLKNFGVSHLPNDGLQQRRERELRVYRDLLTEAGLGTAAYYGSVWDESHGRFWLLLEFVHGTKLVRRDVDYWVAAAGWLGRMQRAVAQQAPRLQACEYLLRHDARFLWSTAELALHAVSHISTSLAGRLIHILSRYDQLVDVMTCQPRTLVHGFYSSRNIVVNLSSVPPRVCPTGWGRAALGAPLYDLAFLLDSCKPPTRDRLWDAYGAEATGCGLSLPDREDMQYVVECFRLHKDIQSLSESLEWGFPVPTVAELIALVERRSNLLLGPPGYGYPDRPSADRRASCEIRRATPEEHPAARAWGELQPGRVAPASIDTLKETAESAVYRLKGVGAGGAAVIAKRCRTTTAAVERTVYEDVLPHLPITALHYYGCTQHDGEFCWLFLENAGAEQFAPYREDHRALAGRWLGLMHTSAARIAAAAQLPDRRPDHYLEHLRSARHTILRTLGNLALSGDDLTLLQAIVAQCDLLESRWSQVETCCGGIPLTLVHGDFQPKNVHVRTDQAGIAVFPLDWETAGWGVPAPDLAVVDLGAYWTVVRECWPVDLGAIQRLANLGKVFRWLAAIRWESAKLEYRGLCKLPSMRICHAELSDAIQAAQWAQ